MLEKAVEVSQHSSAKDPSQKKLTHLRDLLILLSHQQQLSNQRFASCETLEQALLLQMQTHGEKQLKTGAILSELGAAYLKAEGYARAIQNFEHAALIFT